MRKVFEAVGLATMLFATLANAAPSQQELKQRFGHMNRHSVSCATVVSVVRQYGLAQAEQTALAYGMSPNERIRAYACLRRSGVR